MKMIVIRAFGRYSVGDKIEPTGIYREQLVASGFIKPLAAEAAVSPEPENAALPTPKRRTRKTA